MSAPETEKGVQLGLEFGGDGVGVGEPEPAHDCCWHSLWQTEVLLDADHVSVLCPHEIMPSRVPNRGPNRGPDTSQVGQP